MEVNEKQNLDHRDKLSLSLITGSLIIIGIITVTSIIVSIIRNQDFNNILNVIVPLLATWVGTILAFYFGRENFEAASNQYKAIINKLTPEILDDILVNQIMIDNATMVWKELNSVNNLDIREISKFLEDTKKSRLPILENDNVQFIVHKSSFDQAIANNPIPNNPILFSIFATNNKTMITRFLKVPSNSKLELVLGKLKEDEKIQDVFVEENNKVIGWLPDSLIKRYLINH